jgi:hypothetical protein
MKLYLLFLKLHHYYIHSVLCRIFYFINFINADNIVIIVKDRGNLNRVIKMIETEFGMLNLKINKKKSRIMRIMKKVLKKPEIKENKGIKYVKKYKYLGFNLQNTGRLAAHIHFLKIKLKK